jgi:hypothetical protein
MTADIWAPTCRLRSAHRVDLEPPASEQICPKLGRVKAAPGADHEDPPRPRKQRSFLRDIDLRDCPQARGLGGDHLTQVLAERRDWRIFCAQEV